MVALGVLLVERIADKDELTESSPVYLFGGKSKNGQQFGHYLD